MRSLLLLLPLFLVHTSSLWSPSERIAGGPGDPLTHAVFPEWYCGNVLTWDLHTDRLLAPSGADLSNTYDSPFPLIVTCALPFMETIGKFHVFVALQILLILLSSLLVARRLFSGAMAWQVAYVLFAWWSGFYIARVHEHFTLLSGIWGFQLLLWLALSWNLGSRKEGLRAGLVLGLVLSGTFHNLAMLTVPAALLFAHVLYRSRVELKRPAVWINIAMATLVTLAVFGFLFGPAIHGYLTQALRRLPGDRVFYNLDLLSPFVLFPTNLAYDWFEPFARLPNEAFNSYDLVACALAFWAMSRREFWKSGLNRVLALIAALSFLYALGPEIRFGGETLFANPIDAILARIPPFSFSRTPARFASVTGMCFVFFAFSFLAARPEKWPRWLPFALIAWILVTGPVLNQEVRLPTFDYTSFAPMQALREIKSAPEEAIVVNIPAALAQDPSQNFLQIHHGKRITAGYMSYVSYTDEILKPILRDPFLSQLGCERGAFAFTGGGLFSAPDALRRHALEKNYRFWIVNKRIAFAPECERLLGWVRSAAKYPWVQILQENESFVVLAVN